MAFFSDLGSRLLELLYLTVYQLLFVGYIVLVSQFCDGYSDVGSHVMMVTLWWWQFQDNGGRIIMLLTLSTKDYQLPKHVTNTTNTQIVFNICHQHRWSPFSTTGSFMSLLWKVNSTHISKHKTKNAICALSACESTPIELNCVKNSS